MKTSEFVKLREGFIDRIENVFGRATEANEMVDWLFERDVINVEQLELMLEETE